MKERPNPMNTFYKSPPESSSPSTPWRHQDEAIQSFLQTGQGILEMATGTGKTRTAMRIIQELFDSAAITQVLIIMYGNDLLEQWYKELLLYFLDVRICRWYGGKNEFSRFQMGSCDRKILLLSREGERVRDVLDRLEKRGGSLEVREKTLLIFDEVHGAGSEAFRDCLSGILSKYRYRLGLSATPIREFDEEGTAFIMKEIGPVVYTFGLKEAIERGILCEFSYDTISYELTEEEKNKKQKIIAAHEARRKMGQPVNEEDLYRDLARVNKLAVNKILLFQEYISGHPAILERCILFVETKEYGLALQKMLLAHTYNFHTYYSEDDYGNLERFAQGKLQCLITCRKISEGIDIRSVRNIVLFSSDRGHLVTTQRIGRSLRRNPVEPDKRARVVDFICDCGKRKTEDTTADQERADWLRELSEVRRKHA